MSNRYRLVELWNAFGLYIGLPENQWTELDPVLDRLPPLDLSNPRIDRALAEAAMARHFSAKGERPRPIKWCADAQSARAYHPAISHFARHAFPCTDAPTALASAWHARNANAEARPHGEPSSSSRAHADLREKYPGLGVKDEIASWATLLELFAAGCLYYWLGPEEMVCVARPSLWIEHWKLHREDGPAVRWTTGEEYFFWHGVQLPAWVIEQPHKLTPRTIRQEPDLARRYAIIDWFGQDRYLASIPARERISERWNDWRQCYSTADFGIMVRSGAREMFEAVSQRLLAYAQASMHRFTAQDFAHPKIDADAVRQALHRLLQAWHEPARPLRWFEDGRSARAYIAERGTSLARAAYWPKLAISRQFDAAWYNSTLRGAPYPNNIAWLDTVEDWNDWTIASPRARDCADPDTILWRTARLQHCRIAGMNWAAGDPARVVRHVSLSDPVIARWTPLMDAFAAGLFYYWIGAGEIVCIPRPSLWLEDGRLHRADGPAVAWPTSEAYHFWRGVEVPRCMIEQPERITLHQIRHEPNAELRRCMIDLYGQQRFLHDGGARLIAEDECGKLWETGNAHGDPLLLEVTNGTPESDGTRRVYFLRVPPRTRTPREAVAWTYGLSAEQYEIAIRT